MILPPVVSPLSPPPLLSLSLLFLLFFRIIGSFCRIRVTVSFSPVPLLVLRSLQLSSSMTAWSVNRRRRLFTLILILLPVPFGLLVGTLRLLCSFFFATFPCVSSSHFLKTTFLSCFDRASLLPLAHPPLNNCERAALLFLPSCSAPHSTKGC